MGILSSITASIRKRFYDNFSSRTNTSGSLGTSTDGSAWEAINGTIQVISGASKASSIPSLGASGSSYPMATVNLPTKDNSIKLLGTNPGSGVAVWVQSSSDWWLVNSESTTSYAATYATNAYYQYGWNPSTYYSYNLIEASYYYKTTYAQSATYTAPSYYSSTYSIKGSGYYKAWSSSGYSASWFFYTSNQLAYQPSGYGTVSYSQNYQWGTSYSYDYVSGYTSVTNQYIKIKQSVGSVVSEMSSQLVSTSTSIASLIVSIIGNAISASAYSDTSATTQLGSTLSYTASSPTTTTKYGIALSPSAVNQSDIIGTSIDITRN